MEPSSNPPLSSVGVVMWRVGSSHVRRSTYIHTTHILGVVSYGVRGNLAFTLHHCSYIAFTPLFAVGGVSGAAPLHALLCPQCVRMYHAGEVLLQGTLLMLPLSNLYTRKYLATDNMCMTFVKECSFKCQKCSL